MAQFSYFSAFQQINWYLIINFRFKFIEAAQRTIKTPFNSRKIECRHSKICTVNVSAYENYFEHYISYLIKYFIR